MDTMDAMDAMDEMDSLQLNVRIGFHLSLRSILLRTSDLRLADL